MTTLSVNPPKEEQKERLRIIIQRLKYSGRRTKGGNPTSDYIGYWSVTLKDYKKVDVKRLGKELEKRVNELVKEGRIIS